MWRMVRRVAQTTTGERGQDTLEYAGALMLIAMIVAALWLALPPKVVAARVSCAVSDVFRLHSCPASSGGNTAPTPTPTPTSAPTPSPTPTAAANHPCRAPEKCQPSGQPQPAKPPQAPPKQFGSYFYVGAGSDVTLAMPCPPGYDFHQSGGVTGNYYCAWRPYDPKPTWLYEPVDDISNRPGVTNSTGPTGGPSVMPQDKPLDHWSTPQYHLVEAGTPYAHYQFFPYGLSQYEATENLFNQLSSAGDSAKKTSEARQQRAEMWEEAYQQEYSAYEVQYGGTSEYPGEEDPAADGEEEAP